MVSPQHRTYSAKQFQLGHHYEAAIDPNEVLDFTWEFADAFPSAATSFVLSGSVDYGEFTAPVAAVVDATNKLVTLYITGTTSGIASNIVLRASMTINSTPVIIEVSFLLRCRNSTGQVPGPVTSPDYYALAEDVDDLSSTVAGLQTALNAHKVQHTATWYNSVSLSATTAPTTLPFVWVAPFACTINYVALLSAQNTVAASDVNYWSVELRRYRAGSSVVIATKTSQLTGGEGVVQYVPWVFGTLDPTNKILQAGDMVALFFTKFAAGSTWTNVHCTIGFTPA